MKLTAIVALLAAGLLAGPASGQTSGLWTSAAEVARIPTEGCAWQRLIDTSHGADPAAATIEDQDSDQQQDEVIAAVKASV